MAPSRVSGIFVHRHCVFLLLGLLSCLLFWTPLKALIALAVGDERYTHILAIPLISVGLLYLEKRQRITDLAYSPEIGAPLTLLGLALFLVCTIWPVSSGNLSVAVAGLVLVWIGLFISCYGIRTFNYPSAPLLLLFFMVPIPSVVLDKVVTALQVGSAELSYRLFQLIGVPVFRHGTVMSLPGADIEVAPQCSGIRSTMALLIVSVVLSYVLLRSGWARLLVVLCVGPIGIFRNAVRIVGITLLGVYVNKDFFFGNLHRRGGLAFSLVGWAVLIPIVWLLRSWERRAWPGQARATGMGSNRGRKRGSLG